MTVVPLERLASGVRLAVVTALLSAVLYLIGVGLFLPSASSADFVPGASLCLHSDATP